MNEIMSELDKFYRDFPAEINDAARNVLIIMDKISHLRTDPTLSESDKVKLTMIKENLFRTVRKLKMEMMPFLEEANLK